jgi:hypothetical protein
MGQRQKLQGCKDFSTPGLSLKALSVAKGLRRPKQEPRGVAGAPG